MEASDEPADRGGADIVGPAVDLFYEGVLRWEAVEVGVHAAKAAPSLGEVSSVSQGGSDFLGAADHAGVLQQRRLPIVQPGRHLLEVEACESLADGWPAAANDRRPEARLKDRSAKELEDPIVPADALDPERAPALDDILTGHVIPRSMFSLTSS